MNNLTDLIYKCNSYLMTEVSNLNMVSLFGRISSEYILRTRILIIIVKGKFIN